jgi:hypothetical protein
MITVSLSLINDQTVVFGAFCKCLYDVGRVAHIRERSELMWGCWGLAGGGLAQPFLASYFWGCPTLVSPGGACPEAARGSETGWGGP